MFLKNMRNTKGLSIEKSKDQKKKQNKTTNPKNIPPQKV